MTGEGEDSEATAALIIAIAGLLACGLASPIALVMADRELEAIAAGRRDAAFEGRAKLAKGLGALGSTVLLFALLSVVSIVVINVWF